MKSIFKLLPAALAMLTLASCSTDDLFNGETPKTAAEGELLVNVEPFDNMNTRAVREWKGASLNFQEGDEMRVYDDQLFKFDIYSFADSKFTRSNATSNITTVKYAAFPAGDVKRGYFEVDGSVKLEMSIPGTIVYDETKEDLVGNKIAYASNLPMWGTAAADGDGAKADLYHLTGVLAIQVKNMLQNVPQLVLISPTTQISGTFVATLDASNPTSVQLGQGGDDLITDNRIVVDLTSVPSQVSVLYIPILAGVNDLQVWADNDMDGWPTAGDEKVADFTSTYTFQRNKFKTLTADFGIGSTTPAQLSALLDSYKNTLEDKLTIDLEKFYVGYNAGATDATYDGSNTIFVPASEAEIAVNFKNAASFAYGNPDNAVVTNQPLVITDADPADPYTGTFTFNVGTKLATATDITIDLPQADVVLVGDFATKCAARDIRFLAAKSLTIGDGTTPTAIESDGTFPFVFSTGASGVAELTIAANATLTTATPVMFDQYTKKINVNGTYAGNIDFADTYSLFELNIGGAAGNVTGNVWSIGNVNVALTAEGEAIGGTLYMAGAEKTLALKQGYVNAIENCVMVYGTWQKPVNTIKLNNEGQGSAAFLALTDKGDAAGYHNGLDCVASTTELTESVWDGKAITPATYKNQWVLYTENDATVHPAAIMTASQFGSLTIGASAELFNDIDLNNKPWTGKNITGGLDGLDHTISNVALAKNVSNGLFLGTTAAVTIKNLTIDGVSNVLSDMTPIAAVNGIGGLLSSSANVLTVNKVEVKNIAFAGDATRPYNNIGGIVGDATAVVNLTDVKVSGTIDGYTCLGGFIGTTSANVNITTSDCSGISFKQTYNSGKTMDITYAKVGGAVGSVTTSKNVTIDAASLAPASINYDKATLMYVSDTSSENGDFYNFSANTTTPQLFVGYCGNPNTAYGIGTLTIGTKTFQKPSFTGNGQKDSYVVGTTTFYNIYKWANH